MTLRLALFISLALFQSPRYFPETIDSLETSTHRSVSVGGTVTVVTTTQDGTITFRLRDIHGHSIGCILGPTLQNQQPRVGTEIIVSGERKRYTPRDRPAVVEIDPVEKIDATVEH